MVGKSFQETVQAVVVLCLGSFFLKPMRRFTVQPKYVHQSVFDSLLCIFIDFKLYLEQLLHTRAPMLHC